MDFFSFYKNPCKRHLGTKPGRLKKIKTQFILQSWIKLNNRLCSKLYTVLYVNIYKQCRFVISLSSLPPPHHPKRFTDTTLFTPILTINYTCTKETLILVYRYVKKLKTKTKEISILSINRYFSLFYAAHTRKNTQKCFYP